MDHSKNELIAEMVELLFKEPVDFAVLHTDDGGIFNLVEDKIEIAIYESADNDCQILENLLSQCNRDYCVSVNKINKLSSHEFYEKLLYGEVLFVKNREEYNELKYNAMLEYLDFRPNYEKMVSHQLSKMKGD
jgi:hypothetical protein